jgi:SAM-dependent methyltransferase
MKKLLYPLFNIGRIRKLLWKAWYPFLTRRVGREPVLFLNYAFETSPPLAIPLRPEDEADRACIQLYHHVASQIGLKGKDVLEVSCGHGGGASYAARYMGPRRYTGLDLNPAGIRFCRERHTHPALHFIQGDAEKLPLPDNSVDTVINVEASHCYPSFSQFLAEVARVLKPGGDFLYADFRFTEDAPSWEADIAAAPLRTVASRDISSEVLRGMEINSIRSLNLVERFLPSFLHAVGRDFAGIKGSLVNEGLQTGKISYRSYHLHKSLT